MTSSSNTSKNIPFVSKLSRTSILRRFKKLFAIDRDSTYINHIPKHNISNFDPLEFWPTKRSLELVNVVMMDFSCPTQTASIDKNCELIVVVSDEIVQKFLQT